LETFCQLAWPLLADKGVMLAMKGAVDSAELQRLQASEFAVEDQPKSVGRPLAVTAERYRLPVLDSRRSVVVIHKTA
jgi:1,6-anhydro-N-acetylmuramate kinase